MKALRNNRGVGGGSANRFAGVFCVRIVTKSVAVAVFAMAFAAGPGSRASDGAGSTTMLPGRLLTCVLGRATNLDPHREQKRSEVIYEGSHKFALYLPDVPVRTAPPPDATEPPEPVDARTRIVSDPDGLTRDVPRRFDRVIDVWPERVEMTTTIADPVVNLIIVSDIAADGTTANLFMTRAMDLATLDLQNVYSGPCSVKFFRSGAA